MKIIIVATLLGITIAVMFLMIGYSIQKNQDELEELKAKFESGEIEVKGDTDIVDVEPLTYTFIGTYTYECPNIYECPKEDIIIEVGDPNHPLTQ